MVSLEFVRPLAAFRSPHHYGCTLKQGSCFYQRNSIVTLYCGGAIDRIPVTEVADVQYEVYSAKMQNNLVLRGVTASTIEISNFERGGIQNEFC